MRESRMPTASQPILVRLVLGMVALGALALGTALPGCGRTPLDDFADGSYPRLDGGGFDAHLGDAGDAGAECTSDRECDDELFCNGQERCVAGACAEGAAPGGSRRCT